MNNLGNSNQFEEDKMALGSLFSGTAMLFQTSVISKLDIKYLSCAYIKMNNQRNHVHLNEIAMTQETTHINSILSLFYYVFSSTNWESNVSLFVLKDSVVHLSQLILSDIGM